MSDAIIILGGGHAAAQLCAVLADAGQGERTHLICEEAAHPYQRPPLSKSFLKNRDESLQLHRDPAWYTSHKVRVHLGDAAVGIDAPQRKVRLASGEELTYSKLVLATGTRARTLPWLERPLDNVLSLRHVADAQAMRERLQREGGGRLTVLGGGFIGLEVASSAKHLGWDVRVIEVAPRLLQRSTSPELSAYVLEHHRQMGTRVDLGAIVGEPEIRSERLVCLHVDGEPLSIDEMLLGIGAMPEVGLAQTAGLQIDNGICVDAAMVTSDPDILAIGDCTSFDYQGRRIRLESVQNANDQAKIAAETLLGRAASYRPTPHFWSDQGGAKLQMVGLWHPQLSAVRRPGATPASFSFFHYEGSHLIAVESVNAPVDQMWSRKLLERGISPTPDQASDPAFALKTLM